MKSNKIKTACIFEVPGDGSFLSNGIVFYQEYIQNYPKDTANFKHVGMVLDWPIGIHSTVARGVHRINIPETYPNAVILQHSSLKDDSALRNKIALDALKDLHMQYDIISLCLFPFKYVIKVIEHLFKLRPEKRVFCSEFVTRKYRGRGVSLANGTHNPERVTPADIIADSHTEIIIDLAKEDYDK